MLLPSARTGIFMRVLSEAAVFHLGSLACWRDEVESGLNRLSARDPPTIASTRASASSDSGSRLLCGMPTSSSRSIRACRWRMTPVIRLADRVGSAVNASGP